MYGLVILSNASDCVHLECAQGMIDSTIMLFSFRNPVEIEQLEQVLFVLVMNLIFVIWVS